MLVAGILGLTITGHPQEQDVSDASATNLEDPLSVQEICSIFTFMRDRLHKCCCGIGLVDID